MKPSKPKKPNHNKKPQQVRIIGGIWKRTPLAVANLDGLRPTPDRVRETVFNWIGHLIGGNWGGMTCLDLFAGTGALGFEAVSRGAAQATLVESHPVALRQLDATREKLNAVQVTVLRGDALTVTQRLAAGAQRFDLVFLDPPYDQDWLPRTLPACRPLLKDGGMAYVESPVPLDRFAEGETPAWLSDWEVLRTDRAGMVHFYLLQKANGTVFKA